MPDHYLGLISGTSMDGIDAALVRITDGGDFSFIDAALFPYPAHVREGLAAVHESGAVLERLGQLDAALGELFAVAAIELLDRGSVDAGSVRAIGSHGQTVLHHPRPPHPFSLQLGQPAVIAQRTGITTVADFRPRDMAAGGQGAPLAPAFHDAVLRRNGRSLAVVNLGGIANITCLPSDPGDPATGFDTGPANTLLDYWYHRHHGQPFDRDGEWARGGTVHTGLLQSLLADQYFTATAPKSTGPEYFSPPWLTSSLAGHPGVDPRDVQATLLELTAVTVAQSIQGCPTPQEVLVCGGGVHNRALMDRLTELLHPVPVRSTAGAGVDPDWVEACCFAWLAWRTLQGLPGNLPAVTGARQAVPLGAIWPATGPAQMDIETFTDGG